MKLIFEVDLTRDVVTVETMVASLRPYIYESELYGLMPGNLPRLTLGGLLMRLYRLAALESSLTPIQRESVAETRRKFDEVRTEWPVAYSNKIDQEIRSRLAAMAQFLKEAEENPGKGGEGFPAQMEKRVIIEHLKDDMDARGKWAFDSNGTLANLDNRLTRISEKSDFCWDPRVESAYPPDKFWFLYRESLRPGKR